MEYIDTFLMAIIILLDVIGLTVLAIILLMAIIRGKRGPIPPMRNPPPPPPRPNKSSHITDWSPSISSSDVSFGGGDFGSSITGNDYSDNSPSSDISFGGGDFGGSGAGSDY